MKFIRFFTNGDNRVRSGIIEGNVVHEFTGNLFLDRTMTGATFLLDDVRLAAPLEPRHIIGIGSNYAAEGAEKPTIPDLPVFFFKPLTTVIGPGEHIVLPQGSNGVKFESELAVIIGREAKNISQDEADSVIFGYTVANDVSAGDYFHPQGHWTIGKSFDTFCPLGPVLVTDFEYRTARIQCEINNEPKQNSSIERMIMPIDRMIAYISGFMTLMPGDVILTGTPAGADTIRAGDVVDCFVEGIGHLVNQVRSHGGSSNGH